MVASQRALILLKTLGTCFALVFSYSSKMGIHCFRTTCCSCFIDSSFGRIPYTMKPQKSYLIREHIQPPPFSSGEMRKTARPGVNKQAFNMRINLRSEDFQRKDLWGFAW
jgi:hypothetical protein